MEALKNKAEDLNRIFTEEEGVKLLTPFEYCNELTEGKSEICFSGRIVVTLENQSLEFEVVISHAYPLSLRPNQSIGFTCKAISGYRHQNFNKSICLHPEPDDNLERKAKMELFLLKSWMKKYYIDGEADERYEYLLFPRHAGICMLFEGSENIPATNSEGYFYYRTLPSSVSPRGFLYERCISTNLAGRPPEWTRFMGKTDCKLPTQKTFKAYGFTLKRNQ